MGIEVKDGKVLITCAWPGCGCQEEFKDILDKGWRTFWSHYDDLHDELGVPEGGMLCPHHQETLDACHEALSSGDWERFRLLNSL